MKYIFLLFVCLSASAQNSSNYYSLSYSNNIQILVARQFLLPRSASYSATTNQPTPYTNIDGYYYPSNISGVTRWEIPTDIIKFTNMYININVLETNPNCAVILNYHLSIYTNDLSYGPIYDSGDVNIYSNYPIAGTNILAFNWTNQFFTNISYSFLTTNFPNFPSTNGMIVSTNYNIRPDIMFGTIAFWLGPYTNAAFTNWNAQWLLNGKLQFR